ncbi:hypothetical protein L1887_14471 [Cichorium endivia]|nr:hypothetical protein L1887_14471 [Cichorium endivia]
MHGAVDFQGIAALQVCSYKLVIFHSDGGGAAFYHLSPWVSSAKPPNAAFNHSQGEEWKKCQCYKLIKGLALQEWKNWWNMPPNGLTKCLKEIWETMVTVVVPPSTTYRHGCHQLNHPMLPSTTLKFHYRDYEQLDLFKKRNVLMVIAHPDDESVYG